MAPELFTTSAPEYAAEIFANFVLRKSEIIEPSSTPSGTQIAVYYGHREDELPANIGYYLVLASDTNDRRKKFHDKMIDMVRAADSHLVTHPSYDSSLGGRRGWSIKTKFGLLLIPPEVKTGSKDSPSIRQPYIPDPKGSRNQLAVETETLTPIRPHDPALQ